MTSATTKPRAGEHTPAPWYSDQDGFIYTERDDEDQIVVAKAHEHPRMNATLMNARRIVACVNYCEGIATSFLEGASIGQPVFPEAERDQLRAREAELVDALRSITSGLADHLKAGTVCCDSCASEVANANAALSKVRGA